MNNDEELAKLKAERIANRLQFRKRLLNALDIYALYRLSDRLNPEYVDRQSLVLELAEQWPDRLIEQEFLRLLHKAS